MNSKAINNPIRMTRTQRIMFNAKNQHHVDTADRESVENLESESETFDDSDADPDWEKTVKKRKYDYFNVAELLTEITDDNQTDINNDPLVLPISLQNDVTEIYMEEFCSTSDSTTLKKNQRTETLETIILEVLDNIICRAVAFSKPETIILELLDNIICRAVAFSKKKNKRARTVKDKVHKNLEKHAVLPPCTDSCRKRCNKKVDQNVRESICRSFWKLNYSERHLALDSYIKRQNVKVRTSSAEVNPKRNSTLKFHLPQGHGKEHLEVCKIMFLHTLGLKTDGMVTSHFKEKTSGVANIEITKSDGRGEVARNQAKARKDLLDANIMKHVQNYNPVVSHYKLVHAPNRRYLSCGMTITMLWKDYNTVHEKITYEKFRRVFDTLNIGFDALSQDDCGTCSRYTKHQENDVTELHNVDNCDICVMYHKHRNRYIAARQEYSKDKSAEWSLKFNIFTVDMQKVLILPKMAIKNSVFVSRLVVFNETFAPLHEGDNLCVLWHEAITGRNAPDVASAFYYIIRNANSEVMSFIFWSDNCSAQNKNWLLYSAFVSLVNCDWGPNSITLKYFEPGHSFMKADSVHGQIGKEWKKRNEILDMNDLTDVISKSSEKNKPVLLRHSDFFNFVDGSKQRRKTASGESNMPLLDTIRMAEFRKGHKSLFYKTSFKEEFQESQFLKVKYDLKIPKTLTQDRGLNTVKKK